MDLSRFKLIELSNQISDTIWKEVAIWDKFNKWTTGIQVVRSADSISANLSEAYGRFTYKERKLFCMYARGSLCETINWIQKATERKHIDSRKSEEIMNGLIDISYKLNGYIRSMRKASRRL